MIAVNFSDGASRVMTCGNGSLAAAEQPNLPFKAVSFLSLYAELFIHIHTVLSVTVAIRKDHNLKLGH